MSKNKPSTSSAPRRAPKQTPRTTMVSKPVTHQGKQQPSTKNIAAYGAKAGGKK